MDSTSFFLKRRAFAFIELLVILAVVAILAALLLPALAKAKAKAQRINCVNNLKQDGLAFRMWSDDNGDKYPPRVSTTKGGSMEYVAGGNAFRHFLCMSNELSTPKILACPSDTRKPAQNFSGLKNANVSYFVGVDARETMPQMFLTGDRNLVINDVPIETGLATVKSSDTLSWTQELHQGQGNVGLADGSVQQATAAHLQQMNRHTGTNAYRLAVP
jgi:prepilin-type processing-associated H-X9-DG protein